MRIDAFDIVLGVGCLALGRLVAWRLLIRAALRWYDKYSLGPGVIPHRIYLGPKPWFVHWYDRREALRRTR